MGIIVSTNNNHRLEYSPHRTHTLKHTVLLEETHFKIPFVIEKYYNNVADLSKYLFSSILSTSFWVNNIVDEKKNFENEKIWIKTKILKKIGVSLSLVIFYIITCVWMRFLSDGNFYDGENSITRSTIDNNLDVALGVDGLSLPFILLVGVVLPIVYWSNWSTIEYEEACYILLIVLLELLLLVVFLVVDLVMFYVFFESILPPLFLLIGLYGSTQKFRAGYYIFLYTLCGSLFMLLSFMKIGSDSASTNYDNSQLDCFYAYLQELFWILIFFSLSVKTPLVPFHIWLPLAHSEANVSGSIILASIVLKLALYAFIRILINSFNLASTGFIPVCLFFACMSVYFASSTTVRQFDLKVLVAYASVAHMASSLFGTFSNTLCGLIGSIIFGIAHGFVSPALFFLVGAVLYDRFGTRIINYFKGLSGPNPLFALFFLLFSFANMGVPLTANFIGEFLSLLGSYQQSIYITTIGAISIILSAVYSIFTYNRVASGTVSPFVFTVPDIFRKEYYILLPLLFFTILLGIYPSAIVTDIEFAISHSLLFSLSSVVFIGDKNPNNNDRKYYRPRPQDRENINPDAINPPNTPVDTSNVNENAGIDPQQLESAINRYLDEFMSEALHNLDNPNNSDYTDTPNSTNTTNTPYSTNTPNTPISLGKGIPTTQCPDRPDSCMTESRLAIIEPDSDRTESQPSTKQPGELVAAGAPGGDPDPDKGPGGSTIEEDPDKPEEGSSDKPGEESSDKSEKESSDKSEKRSSDKSEKGSSDNSGEGPGENPGEGPGENPGEGSGENPGEGSGGEGSKTYLRIEEVDLPNSYNKSLSGIDWLERDNIDLNLARMNGYGYDYSLGSTYTFNISNTSNSPTSSWNSSIGSPNSPTGSSSSSSNDSIYSNDSNDSRSSMDSNDSRASMDSNSSNVSNISNVSNNSNSSNVSIFSDNSNVSKESNSSVSSRDSVDSNDSFDSNASIHSESEYELHPVVSVQITMERPKLCLYHNGRIIPIESREEANNIIKNSNGNSSNDNNSNINNSNGNNSNNNISNINNSNSNNSTINSNTNNSNTNSSTSNSNNSNINNSNTNNSNVNNNDSNINESINNNIILKEEFIDELPEFNHMIMIDFWGHIINAIDKIFISNITFVQIFALIITITSIYRGYVIYASLKESLILCYMILKLKIKNRK